MFDTFLGIFILSCLFILFLFFIVKPSFSFFLAEVRKNRSGKPTNSRSLFHVIPLALLLAGVSIPWTGNTSYIIKATGIAMIVTFFLETKLGLWRE